MGAGEGGVENADLNQRQVQSKASGTSKAGWVLAQPQAGPMEWNQGRPREGMWLGAGSEWIM